MKKSNYSKKFRLSEQNKKFIFITFTIGVRCKNIAEHAGSWNIHGGFYWMQFTCDTCEISFLCFQKD